MQETVSYSKSINSPIDSVQNKIIRTLIGKGFTLSSKSDGIIITTAKIVRLTTKEASCGSLMGLPYIKDNRTITRLSYSVTLIDSTMVTVATNIEGVFNSHAGATTITLICTSTGSLERSLLSDI